MRSIEFGILRKCAGLLMAGLLYSFCAANEFSVIIHATSGVDPQKV